MGERWKDSAQGQPKKGCFYRRSPLAVARRAAVGNGAWELARTDDENWENYWRFRARLNKLKVSNYLSGC